MTREQAINYLFSCGFTNEQVGEVVRALTYEPTTKNYSKFCPDRKAKTTNMETILHCIENECAAYKDGKCLKYNSDQEPTTKNNLGVDKFDKAINQSDLEEWIMETFPDWCEGDVRLIMNHMDEMPSVTPKLSVPEVTALAEWTTKLTKECEEAYNKGYADGMKAQAEPKTGHWILDETDNSITCDRCGCLIWANDISNGEAYYCPNCGAKMESEE